MRRILKHKGAGVLLFILAFLAICWPFMAHTLYQVVEERYVHLFIAWAVIILLLFFLSKTAVQDDDNPEG